MNFIAHNVDLGNGKFTLPDTFPVLESTERWKSIERTIKLMFRPEEIPTLRVVDLGCLEGGYSLAFAKLGMQVTGMDAREDNIEKCEWVKSHFDLPNLSYVKDDVKNLANYEQFDVIFCAGLLYHLDEPSSFIKLMHDQTRRMTIIHTHYSLERDSFYDNQRLSFVQRAVKKVFNLPNNHYPQKYDYRLSEVVEHEGYKGRWFHEFSADSSKKAIEKNAEASYSNYKSFWHTKPEILRCFREVGYRMIFEQYDFIGKYTGWDYTEKHDRGMFVLMR
ncbi:MAG: methyltransferase domain-containing protein [Bacteroidetes bacterium]|nr:methyltransferase domain-containing protein [Bacteroidota bacterium]